MTPWQLAISNCRSTSAPKTGRYVEEPCNRCHEMMWKDTAHGEKYCDKCKPIVKLEQSRLIMRMRRATKTVVQK